MPARLTLVIATLILLSGNAHARNASGRSLSISAGPRAVSMGETGTALSGDAFSAYWNPAALATLGSPRAGFTHNRFLQDVEHQYLSLAVPSRRDTWALDVTRLGVRPFPGYDELGRPTDKISALSLITGLYWGRALLGSALAIGIGGKWISEHLGPSAAQAFAVDLGLQTRTTNLLWADELRLGASLSNLGTRLRFDQDRERLPATTRLGIAWSKAIGIPLTVNGELSKIYAQPVTLGIGSELLVHKMLFLRAGYRGGDFAGLPWRLGFGIKIKDVAFDYAWADLGAFGPAHRIGLTLYFPKHPPRPKTNDTKIPRLRLRSDENQADGMQKPKKIKDNPQKRMKKDHERKPPSSITQDPASTQEKQPEPLPEKTGDSFIWRFLQTALLGCALLLLTLLFK